MRVKHQRVTGSLPEEIDSPTHSTSPVAGRHRWRNSNMEKGITGGGLFLPLHSQILKIRDEDSHLGEDMIYQALNLFDANNEYFNNDNKASKVLVMSTLMTTTSRPILPASPLGGTGRTAANNKFAD